ncbi:MAG: hypothetical protein AAF462_06320 [Thermodesulfobacteriota bacterium]
MINQKTYKQLIRGLEQQLWFFGQDTAVREDNLFEQYGFSRYRTPGHGGSSRYKITWCDRTVDLHSFCVGIYGDNHDGFLFVRAHDQAYCYLGEKPPLPGRYRSSFLMLPKDKESKGRFYEASCEFLEWIEDYESWIDATYGKGYRLDCYARYHRKWLAPDQARKWFREYRESQSKIKVSKTA